jgi:hypothetical protein
VLSGGVLTALIGEFGKTVACHGVLVWILTRSPRYAQHAIFPPRRSRCVVFGEVEHEIAALLHAGDLSNKTACMRGTPSLPTRVTRSSMPKAMSIRVWMLWTQAVSEQSNSKTETAHPVRQ